MGVIPKAAIRQFLARERGDYRKWKNYKFNKLDALMEKLPARPPIWRRLRKHQRVCLLLGARHGSWAFFLDTGCGKTLLSIALARYFEKVKRGKVFLVLVPNRINMFEWGDEITKHSPNTKYTILGGSSKEKWAAVQKGDSLLYVTTYMGLLHMVCKTTVTKKGVTKMTPWDKQINALLRIVDGFFFDESTELGNPDSLTYRICRRFAKAKNKLVYPLTGTPFGKDPKPLWAQMFLVDLGHSLGETLGLFRSAFYSETMNQMSGFPEYHFEKKKAKLLHEFIAARSITYEAEATSLPKLIPVVKEVNMSSDAEAHYYAVQDEFRSALEVQGPKDLTVIKNSFLRLRQISSGFIGYHDDETGERASLEFKDNPKLDLLLSILDEVTPRYKVVVYCQFTISGAMICRELTKVKIGHQRIYGGTKDQKVVLEAFKTDESCRVLVLNNDCGGFGLNLQIARYGIYFESPISPIMRKQTRRRVERQGSDHSSVFIYDLITRGTYDHANLAALEEGKNLLEEVLRGKAKDFIFGK